MYARNVHSFSMGLAAPSGDLIVVRYIDKTEGGHPMRDIRADLKERLASMEAERNAIQAKARELDERIAALMKMLDVEDEIFSKDEAEKPKPKKLITEFVYEQLALRRMNKDEIQAVVVRAGYNIGRRSIHLTLVNLERVGRIRRGQDGRYERATDRRGDDERPPSFSGDMPRSH